MSSSSSEGRKLILPGPPVAFHTQYTPGQHTLGQALRFCTQGRALAMPMATSITVETAPTATEATTPATST